MKPVRNVKRRSRLFAIVAAAVLAVLWSGGAPTSTAAEARPGFVEVRYDGGLWYYEHTDFGFVGYWLGAGWDRTSLVALVDPRGLLAEVKDGALRLWHLNLANHELAFVADVMHGWENARLITGAGDVNGDAVPDFVEVNTAGELMLWLGRGTGFVNAGVRSWGWQNARQITGSGQNRFVEIKTNGELWSWTIPHPNPTEPWWALGYQTMAGWGNVRLLGPDGLADSFVSVRFDTELVQWTTGQGVFAPIYHDWGWDNARLLG
ncbi:hypothetical protein [Amycolatopsis anabasis]|uniref:hypothetical protein n=1 Tax=Amycolatopsis anabasis TaxID=1840409 RepID=UPI00131CC89F|nr:hypothetical protein [Amycolatopsis anabasis]